MKRFLKLLFCLPLGITLLTGCNNDKSIDFAKNSFKNIFFKIYDKKDNKDEFIFDVPVIDMINLSESEFFTQYFNATPDTRYEYYSLKRVIYKSGEDFIFDYESIRHGINSRFQYIGDLNYEGGLYTDLIFYYTPTEYTITYVGLGDDTPSPSKYTVNSGGNLPLINSKFDHRILDGWSIQGTDTIITRYPSDNPANIVVEPHFKNIEYTIDYKFPPGLVLNNPNVKKYTYYDEPITLTDLPDHPDGAYTFDGFYLNDEKITVIDPHIGKDIELECRFTLKEYTVKYYVDDELIDTKTFNYRTIKLVTPPAVPEKDHLKNGRWDDKVKEFRDYEIHAVYDKEVYQITYTYPFEGIENPNITSFTAFDGEVSLEALADSDKGYYTFDGFYLNGKKITTLDTSIGKDITLEARFNFTEYTVNYYDGNTKLYTDTFTFLTFKDYVQRAVPDKEHYKDGEWSQEIKEIKDYDIYVSYTPKDYTVKIISNIDGEQVSKDFVVTYNDGTTFSTLVDKLSFADKYFIGLYSDANYSKAVDLSSSAVKDVTLYAKWGTDVYIKTAADWSKIVQDPAGHYYLSSNISFTMDAIPVVDNFTGVLDGCSHTIQRFTNSKTNCDATYGLFKTNKGIIKNLVIEDCSFVSSNANGSDRVYCGLLCGTNKGIIDNIDFVSAIANITANYYINIDDFSSKYGYCYVGLCCGNNQGTIKNCSISDDSQLTVKAKMGYYRTCGYGSSDYLMYGYFYYGLLAGLNTGTITNITSDGTLLVNGIALDESKKGWSYELMDGVEYLVRSGGIVGRNGNSSDNASLTNSISNATITVDYSDPVISTSFGTENRIGGIVGNNEATIENCYTSALASLNNHRKGDVEMGGIAGRQENTGKVKGCYSECAFFNNNSVGIIRIGGIIGCNNGSLSYCYAIVNDVTVTGTNNRGGGVGALVGYTSDTSTVMFCFGTIEITNEISILSCYDLGSATSNAIINKVSIYAPDQTNTIDHNEKITTVGTFEALIQVARSYYFNEVGFKLYDDKLPTLESIGK